MIMRIQEMIHQVEEGGGLRHLKPMLLLLALVGLVVTYNLRGFRNMANPEAMDAAQVARNLAEHQGYTTLFIRPFSTYLLEKTEMDKNGLPAAPDLSDRARLRTSHPDLANPPVYPLLLAGLMKISPGMRYQAAGTATLKLGRKKLKIWNLNGAFWIYPPDFWISLFNQLLLLGVALGLFFFARQLFDDSVAWSAAIIFLGTELFWKFAMSGLSTILLLGIFLGLCWCLMNLEQKVREAELPFRRQLLWAVLTGALVGIGCLTRYSFGWLILPVGAFLFLFLSEHRIVLGVTALAVFLAVVTPWTLRNYRLSHTLFGTASYAMYETTTPYFPEDRLERSLTPDLTRVRYDHIWNKFVSNTGVIFQQDLPRLGGNWLGAFFIVGMFIHFHSPTRNRLRYFLLMCLPVLVIAQALTRTQLSVDTPIINSENLIVLVAPLVIVFGVSMFFTLLDQMRLGIRELRLLFIWCFVLVSCLPMILGFFATRTIAVAYPPYFPPVIQRSANWMNRDELMMSDVPWAVAWYGQRQCMWLTLDAQSEFYSVTDLQKPVKAVYLTPVTLDAPFLSQWVKAGDHSWGALAINSMLKNELPKYFPLTHAPLGFLPEQLFLTDSDRWNLPANSPAAQLQVP